MPVVLVHNDVVLIRTTPGMMWKVSTTITPQSIVPW